ncbi:hypothetical protein [Flavobacterium wongokense]|uniref:hypothetical protein n=1 Tax=Flavobacterium wongokense TaxID=2910674 RepID=UPI001F27E784|nr:hypothetical protein [Flavobacterium sp. WG47]MCF6130816.1 hypothetical protein [Flavobacterium sp. WG47]
MSKIETTVRNIETAVGYIELAGFNTINVTRTTKIAVGSIEMAAQRFIVDPNYIETNYRKIAVDRGIFKRGWEDNVTETCN